MPQEGNRFLDIVDDTYSVMIMFGHTDTITRGYITNTHSSRNLSKQ